MKINFTGLARLIEKLSKWADSPTKSPRSFYQVAFDRKLIAIAKQNGAVTEDDKRFWASEDNFGGLFHEWYEHTFRQSWKFSKSYVASAGVALLATVADSVYQVVNPSPLIHFTVCCLCFLFGLYYCVNLVRVLIKWSEEQMPRRYILDALAAGSFWVFLTIFSLIYIIMDNPWT
ncbi:hypothetical protein SAMN05216327_11867 [Dyadobacter sp. SG02]|uniref:hypothetical protein n=1 Tax=Dyadobacter sp. SG02 TaxID=1855291 RepID=UPI0008CC7275|nr:hypothetical protein [Dyadobacter sp. SG02]SEJ74916.1 hypothetical protein SAMN05216327_11867 [Dyadobacter sp. SG02]